MFCKNIIPSLLIFLCCAGCEKIIGVKNPSRDNPAVFNDVVKVMGERYALFPVKGVIWDSVASRYRGQASASVDEHTLFRNITLMLEELKDGHVSLMSQTDTFRYDAFITSHPRNFNFPNIVANYLLSDYQRIGPYIFKSDEGIGYLYCPSFADDLSADDLDQLFAALKTVRALIIDVRDNPGGSTQSAAGVLSIMLKERTLVRYEVRKTGTRPDDFAQPEPVYVSPYGPGFNGQVIVLTNRSCYSACNDFVSALSSWQNVRIVGDSTGGGGGIPAEYLLANGWKLRYTSSMTLNTDRQSIESGVAPDEAASVSSVDEAQGKDPILERALFLLR
jgi:Peptidase family S41